MAGLNLECEPDESVAKKLGYFKKEIQHHSGRDNVYGYLESNSDSIAMVDEDPGSTKHAYSRLFKETSFKYQVRVMVDEERKNTAVILCPKLEDWLLGVCKTNGIDITTFGLSSRSNQLHRETVSKPKNLEKLLDHLIEMKVPAIIHLKNVLRK